MERLDLSEDELAALIKAFYARVRADAELGHLSEEELAEMERSRGQERDRGRGDRDRGRGDRGRGDRDRGGRDRDRGGSRGRPRR